MIKTPEQQIYDRAYQVISELGYAIVMFKKPPHKQFPFVEIADTQTVHSVTKTRLLGTVTVPIHVYGTEYMRREVSDIVGEVRTALSQIKQTEGFYWSVSHRQTKTRIMRDTSTDTLYWHGVLELYFNFN